MDEHEPWPQRRYMNLEELKRQDLEHGTLIEVACCKLLSDFR